MTTVPVSDTATTIEGKRLSVRQTAVLSMAAQGLRDKEIAHELGIELSTVRAYWKRMFQSLDMNRGEILTSYGRSGVVHGTLLKPDAFVVRTLVGTADREGSEYEMSILPKTGQPVVRNTATKKGWTIPWEELVAMAVKAGV